jgi:hypothetical protein
MKKLTFLFLLLTPILFSSCFDILEEIYLDKSGKGTYLYTIDMSALMDESMKEMLQSMGGEGEEQDNSLDGIEMDSVMYFKDDASIDWSGFERPEVMKRSFLKIQMSDEQDKMVLQFGLNFEHVDEIAYFLQNIDKVSGSSMEDNPMGGGLLPSGTASELFQLKGKKLTRLVGPEMGNDINDEDMSMMSMFMESATFKTVYYLPGKVKKTNIPGAVMDGNTLIVESSLLDLMQGNANPSGWVKFK